MILISVSTIYRKNVNGRDVVHVLLFPGSFKYVMINSVRAGYERF